MRSWLLFIIVFPFLLQGILEPYLFFLDGVERTEPPLWDENEGDHYPCEREWWNVDAFFESRGKNWSLTASFEYEMETPACNLFLTLFNLDNGTSYSLGSYGDEIGTLLYEKEAVDLRYGNSWMKGRYPDYFVHFESGGFSIQMHYKAVVPPKFVADDISSGTLPMGFGYYIYGFIPLCTVEGNISLNGNTSSLTGKGYYEHVWGNWTYGNPFKNPSDFRKVASAYGHLAKWWLGHRRLSIPSSITLSSSNNMFGYDWVWAVFSNNWSLFYGNILFWIMKGPVFGILYLTTSEGEYITFCNIYHDYKKMVYVEEYDIYYPSEISLVAREKSKKLYLRFLMKTDVHTYLDTNLSSPYWRAIALYEAPGIVTGYYDDGDTNITLIGNCEIEPERQISVLGHGSINIQFLSPSKGFGIEIEAISHFLSAKSKAGIHLFPFPKPYFSFHFLRAL